MISSVDYLELANKINSNFFADYLVQRGWKSIKRKRQDIKVFQITQDNSLFQITIPFDVSLSDYDYVILESVKTLAKVERKTIDQVFLYLSNPDSDVLKIHINKNNITQGSILIDDAINVFEGVKKLLWAAAQDVVNPSIIHRGRVDSKVSEFISKCRFGQTEIGSYVVSVVCPLFPNEDLNDEQLPLFDLTNYQHSFTRKVTTQVMRAVAEVKTQVDNGSFYNSFEKEENVISSNFYEALIGMNLSHEDTTIELESCWSSKEPVSEEIPSSVSLNHNYYDPINSVVAKIKEKDSEQQITIRGRVKRLEASPDIGKRETGKITIVFLNEKNAARTITANLAKQDYNNAIEAHSKGYICKLTGKYIDGNAKVIACDSFEILD